MAIDAERHDQLDPVVLDVVDLGLRRAVRADHDVLGADAGGDLVGTLRPHGARARPASTERELAGERGQLAVVELALGRFIAGEPTKPATKMSRGLL